MDGKSTSIDSVDPASDDTRPQDAVLSDWKSNWVSRIAIKITAPLMWFLVFIGTAVSILLSGDIDKKIRLDLGNQADHHAFAISRVLATHREAIDTIGRRIVDRNTDRFSFTAVRFHYGTTTKYFGGAAGNDEILTRPILGSVGNGIVGKVEFYHPPVKALVKRERVRLLVTAGVPLLLLGVVLSVLINLVVVGPIQNLVQATRRISAGDLSLRLNSERQDEFGFLERFFDEMLDKLQEQKDQIQAALDSAQAADRIKSQFLANMSHELRTPLNAIIGYSELLMESLGDKQERRTNYQQDLARIRSSGRHLLTLINDVLDIAKIEAGKMEIVETRFSIPHMIKDVEITAKPLMIQNNNRYELHCPDDIGEMNSDQLRIRQILINLLSNAAKFTRDGIVKLSVQRFEVNDLDWIRFQVEDTGIGISEKDSKRLFNEFAQIEDHTVGKPVGTGLGLAISRKFCELLGGTIRLESTPGEGSVFTVELPADLP